MRQRVRAADRQVMNPAEPDDRDEEAEAVAGVQVGPPLDTLAVERGAQFRGFEQLIDQYLWRLLEFLRLEAYFAPELEPPAGGLGLAEGFAARFVGHRGVQKRCQVAVVGHHLAANLVEYFRIMPRVAGDTLARLVRQLGPIDDERRAAVGERDSDLRGGRGPSRP